jgi:GNAT superfamily N-acetyltransferase
MNNLTIKLATEQDIDLIFQFIMELAEYEGLAHEVVTTKETLDHSLFVRQSAEVILAYSGDEPIGFALFFHNFSTFLGRPGLYLEDLYIKETYRKKGYGTQLIAFLANLAKERDCGRLEWWCLDENAPSIRFYKQLGAQAMDEWTVFRLTGSSLDEMANRLEESNN